MPKYRKLKNSELDRKSIEEFRQTEKMPLIVILDNIRSLNNIGSIFRTADAFLVKKIYLCGITAIPPHKDIQKTALGATESVEWEYREDIFGLLTELKQQQVKILSIEQTEDSIMLQKFLPDPTSQFALVFGNEVKGVQQKVVSNSDLILEIPQEGSKHSLNISVSAGVVLWDLYSKLR